MSEYRSIADRIEHACRLLDWLSAEAPALGPHHVMLQLDEIRGVLLASDTSGCESEERRVTVRADAQEMADTLTHSPPEPEPVRHWVLLARPQPGLGAPLGCYPKPDAAKRAAEEWSGSPLDWRWMKAGPEFGFPWNRASWHADALVTRPDELLDDDLVDLSIYPRPDPIVGHPSPEQG